MTIKLPIFWQSLAFVFFFIVPSIAFGATLESNEGSSVDMENYGTDSAKGQSFTHSVDYDIDSVGIFGGLGNSPATNVDIIFYEGSGDGGSVFCTESAYDVTGWPNWSVADWQEIPVTCTGFVGGDTYTFYVVANDGSGSDAIRWATSDTSYGGGEEYIGGSAQSGQDTMFRINGSESGSGGGGGTTTVASTTLVVNPSQDYFNAILLFYLTLFLMLYLFHRRK